MSSDDSQDYEVGYKKPPVATRFKPGNTVNSHRRPRQAATLAEVLQRALDAPAVGPDGKRRRLSKRELTIRGLVERSAGADLAAIKLLFDLLAKADPGAVAGDPNKEMSFDQDALTVLKRRLTRLANKQKETSAPPAAGRTDPADSR